MLKVSIAKVVRVLRPYRHGRCMLLWSLPLIVVFLLCLLISVYDISQGMSAGLDGSRFVHAQYCNSCKTILLWTPWFGIIDWSYGIGEAPFKHCPGKERCVLTASKDRFMYSDAILVHIRDLPGGVSTLPVQNRPPQQLWGFMSMESPYNTFDTWTEDKPDLSAYNGLFDLTLTYRLDSDVPVVYGRYVAKQSKTSRAHNTVELPLKSTNPNYAAGKTRMVLWYVSNCHTPTTKYRMKYANDLQQHVPVDIYGSCGKQDPCLQYSNTQKKTCDDELNKSYKFYMAFENCRCKDYVTEKFWTALSKGHLPIVLGASMADYARIAPPNSFIHVDNFTSVKALADYLVYLDQNDDVYNRYMLWREDYEITRDTTDLCQLCHVVHNPSQPRRPYNISQWYGVDSNCQG